MCNQKNQSKPNPFLADMNLPVTEMQTDEEATVFLNNYGFDKDDIEHWCRKVNCNITSLADYVIRANTNEERPKDYLGKLLDTQKELTEANRLNAEEELKKESAREWLLHYYEYVEMTKKQKQIRTGYPSLDEKIGGGLFPGLYFIGAVSSLGKTTFVLQMADQIARSGEDVLIFSLEMSAEELCAKTISRLTYRNGLKKAQELRDSGYMYLAKSTREILNGRLHENYGNRELNLINDSIDEYQEYAEHINIKVGIGNVSVLKTEGNISIEEELEKYVAIKGHAPVVFIDYLQILAPYVDPVHPNRSLTDKQSMDKNVLELKRLSRDYDIPIIGISSLNRESYTDPINMKAFKESGAIEYSSDVLLGLQYSGMDYVDGEADKDRRYRIKALLEDAQERGNSGKEQKIEIKILKNRNGQRGSICMDFYPMYNYFTESPKREGRRQI